MIRSLLFTVYKALYCDISEFITKVDELRHLQSKSYFSKGELVETETGERGLVWKIYRSTKTNEIIACSVIWEDEYQGEKFSLLIPAIDKGKKFNPIIRKVNDL